MRPRRPVLAGNNTAAISVLDLLLQNLDAHDLLVVGPPGGRKHDWQPSLSEHAEVRGVQTIEPTEVNAPEVVDAIRDHGCDLLLSIYYTQIFSPQLLDVVAGPALNFHPSLLPRHRGSAPLIWAIAEGDQATGLSVHDLTTGVDTGPLRYQHPIPIHPDDTGFTLHQKMANLVRSTAAELLRALYVDRDIPQPRPQSGAASYHSSKDPQINRISWSEPRARVRNVVRALANPLPGAFTYVGDRRVVIDRVELADAAGPNQTPGMVDRGREGEILVWAGDGPLRLDLVRLDGQEAHAADALGLEVGELLG